MIRTAVRSGLPHSLIPNPSISSNSMRFVLISSQPHDGDLEHFAYIERVCGPFPESMFSNARSEAALECFDNVARTVRTDRLALENQEERAKITARLRRRAPLKVRCEPILLPMSHSHISPPPQPPLASFPRACFPTPRTRLL